MKKKQAAQSPDGTDLLDYWKRELAEYVRAKRTRLESKQEAVGSRSTISKFEREVSDPRLSTILNVLEAVHGDVSEAFKSRVPPVFRGPHQIHHETLQKILEDGDPATRQIVTAVLEKFAPVKEKAG